MPVREASKQFYNPIVKVATSRLNTMPQRHEIAGWHHSRKQDRKHHIARRLCASHVLPRIINDARLRSTVGVVVGARTFRIVRALFVRN